MTAFLFLQKFDSGVPSAMPYAPVMARLARVGALGRGAGDMEIALLANVMAVTCTVVGDAQEGIVCIGFERPRFDDALRQLVWDCMAQFGCAVFDDTLKTVCTTGQGRASLPASLLGACRPGARQVSSAQQLWPDDFEPGQEGPPRPALRYPNPNPHGPDLQLFDYAGPNAMELYVDIDMRAHACNRGSLRVLRNVALRIDAAISANPEYAAVFRYSEHETSLLLLESAPVGQLANRSTIVTRGPGELAQGDGFVADRGIFASEDAQSAQFIRHAQQKHAVALNAGLPALDLLAGLLDQAHAGYCAERGRLGSGAAFASPAAAAWARSAGAYLGHSIVQHIGAQWGYFSRGQQRVLALRTHGGRIVCPHHMVIDHVINGSADSIMHVVRALMRDEAESTPRGEDLVCQIPVLCEQLRGPRPLDGGQDLPLVHALARGKLDFSVASLHQLDHYLAQLARGLGELSDQALTDAILCAGAYLGETIRSNAADIGPWQWMTYEQAVRRDPGFEQSRPREMTLLAILDSPEQMAYPFAHAAAILTGSATSTAHAYASRLMGGAGNVPVHQPGLKASREEEVESALEQTQRHAEWSAIMRGDEARVETGASGGGVAILVLVMLVLAYAVVSSLMAFADASATLGLGMKLVYGAWIIGPCLWMAAYSYKIRRRALPQAGMLAGAILMAFSTIVAHSSAAPTGAPDDLTVFLWLPLAQFIWTGGWIFKMRRYNDTA